MQDEIKHQRTIAQLRKNSAESDFWVLINYGDLHQKKTDKIFYRDADFVKSKSNSYDLKHWDKNNVIRIELAETKTMLFSLGTIFNYKGFPVNDPKEDNEFLNTYKVVISNGLNNFKILPTADVFEKTNYPLYRNQISTDLKEPRNMMFYHNRIFKNSQSEESNDYETKNLESSQNTILKNSEYIIPNDLIRKLFYYKSYSGINSILYKKLEHGILNKRLIDGQWMVQYNSDYIHKKDISSFAKYWFTFETGDNIKTGLDRLNSQIKKFWISLYNNSKNSEINIYSTINFPIPFSFPIEVKILGQWITDYDSNEKKFIAYKIVSFSKYKIQKFKGVKSQFYVVNGFSAIDINDKTSTDERENKEIKESGAKILANSEGIKYNYKDDNKPTNSYLDTITSNYISTTDIEGLDLDIYFIKREDQQFAYISNCFINKYSTGLGDDLEHTDPQSSLQKNNILINTNVVSFECIMESMEILKNNYQFFNYQYITINDSINYPYSEVQFIFSSQKTKKTKNELLIIKIRNNNEEYCLLEAGAGKCIGIFKNIGFPIKDANDENLIDFLNFIIEEHQYLWSSFYVEKKLNLINVNYNMDLLEVTEKTKKCRFLLEKYRYEILQPIYHKSRVKENQTLSDDLARRIYSRLK